MWRFQLFGTASDVNLYLKALFSFLLFLIFKKCKQTVRIILFPFIHTQWVTHYTELQS